MSVFELNLKNNDKSQIFRLWFIRFKSIAKSLRMKGIFTCIADKQLKIYKINLGLKHDDNLESSMCKMRQENHYAFIHDTLLLFILYKLLCRIIIKR